MINVREKGLPCDLLLNVDLLPSLNNFNFHLLLFDFLFRLGRLSEENPALDDAVHGAFYNIKWHLEMIGKFGLSLSRIHFDVVGSFLQFESPPRVCNFNVIYVFGSHSSLISERSLQTEGGGEA